MNHSASRKPRMAPSVVRVMYTNAVYFPNSSIYRGDSPGMLNYSCINHVYYAYASVTTNGNIFLGDEWADTRALVDGVNGGLGSLMHLKQKHPHLQVVLSVGGGTAAEVYPIVAASALLRDNFARSALGLVEASGLDGIDVAWECPNDAEQGRNFVALLAAMRIHMPDDRFILTAALPASRQVLQLVDVRTAAEYLDFINLMAFDFFGTWTAKSGHHAQLYGSSKAEPSASAAVRYLMAQGFPAKSILLGIPTYGRGSLQATGPVQSFRESSGDDGTFEYNELPLRGSDEWVDKRCIAAQCMGQGGGVVSYDNPETVRMKAAFCKQKGLGGLFYWNAPADSREPSRSLIAAGFRALHGL